MPAKKSKPAPAERKAAIQRDAIAEHDMIFGDQINNWPADQQLVLERLDAIIALLRAQAPVHVEASDAGNVIRVGDVRIPANDVGQFARLRPQASAPLREKIYLTRFILAETYARWEQLYLPLAGQLSDAPQLLDAPLRLTDRADEGLGSAGLGVPDVRHALTQHRKTRLVILGEPGAGKTTTLHRLALDLARERLRDPLAGKIPVRVDLFNFIGKDQLPADFLRAHWEVTGLPQSYGEAIANGQVCFLLDGVNQMPSADRGARIDRWAAWANSEVDLPPGNWAVFTCRLADYEKDLNLPQVQVQELDAGRMRQYFDLRFPQADLAAHHWQVFERRLRSGDDRFDRLARNPFMLALLADRAAEGQSLEGASRAALMDDLAERRLKHELESGAGRHPDTLTADPRNTRGAMLEALTRLAFAMQKQGEGTRFTRATARKVALAEKGHLRLTLDEVIHLGVCANLLEVANGKEEDEGAVFTFYHHLLQEYFAARELLRQFRAGKNLRRYWRVGWRWWQIPSGPLQRGRRLPPPPVTGWEEIVSLTAGLAGKDASRFIAAVTDDNLPLAGRCAAEAGPERDTLRVVADQLRSTLLTRQRTTTGFIHRPHIRARIDAGLALGELGHPDLRPQSFEFEGHTVWATVPPLHSVAAGEFVRGSEHTDTRAYQNENTTERKVTLPAFFMSRYPVTNAEFKFFLEGRGYTTDRWWSEAGLQWKHGGPDAHEAAMEDWLNTRSYLQKQNLEQMARERGYRPQWTRFWKDVTKLSDNEARDRARQIFDRPFDRPGYWDDPTLNAPARPVVGVNWHEATAYCAWLSAITQHEFRLPSEMEWEKAARGPSTSSGDGREYPWGETFDPALCNSVESHVFTTTPVGLYPGGASPYGLLDMSGNVWEWTADWYAMYPGGEYSDDFGEKFRVVRGGSWNNSRRYARCAFRSGYVPGNFNDDIGFRLCSPAHIPAF